MRILYVTDALAVWGGIERVLSDKMNSLVADYGYDVHIVTTDQGNHPIPYPLDNRVKFHDLNVRYHHQYRFRGLKRLFKFWELNKLFLLRLKWSVATINPDIIVCIRIESIGIILKAKGNIPLICESHSLCYASHYEQTSLLNRIRLHYARKRVGKADRIVTLTNGDANDWRKYNRNVVTIPNVVNLNESGLYSNHKSRIVIFVGRFSEQKDVWSLLQIWKLVYQRHQEWQLYAYGEGEEKADFEDAVRKCGMINVRVFPPTPHIFQKYIESSMLIMTSKYEPFGLVLPEAMSCGLPVIAFDCPYGPADIISDGLDGFLIEKHDINNFVDKVCLLIENVDLRKRMGVNASKKILKYKASSIMPHWMSLFESVKKSNSTQLINRKCDAEKKN